MLTCICSTQLVFVESLLVTGMSDKGFDHQRGKKAKISSLTTYETRVARALSCQNFVTQSPAVTQLHPVLSHPRLTNNYLASSTVDACTVTLALVHPHLQM